MTRILDLLRSNDPRDIIHQVVQALAEGELAVLPLDGSYALTALATHSEAVSRLEEAAPAGTEGGLVIASSAAAADYLPLLTPTQERLLQRAWPGPVVFRFPGALTAGLGVELPTVAQRQIAPENQLQLLVTADETVVEILRLLSGPLLARLPAASDAIVEEVAQNDWPAAGVVLQIGRLEPAGLTTAVRVLGEQRRVERQGLVDLDAIREAGCETFLFVCTGNTCRSPMAAAVFRKLLAARLQCREEDLPAQGYRVVSAGLAASPGMPASPEAVELIEQNGGRLAEHQSQPLSARLLEQADYVFTMTHIHRATILQHYPELSSRVRTLADDGDEVVDPIGHGMDEYERCLKQITRYLERVLSRLQT